MTVTETDTLRAAVDKMAKENIDVLPVVSEESNQLVSILSYKDILSSYRITADEHEKRNTHISIKRRALKILSHGKNKMLTLREQRKN